MFDVNGKVLHVGDDILSYCYGMLTIKRIIETLDDSQGTLIECCGSKGIVEIRTITERVVKARTWKELAKEALDVQDASNLSGVLNTFATICAEVRARLNAEGNGGNDNLHAHPVIVLFSNKVTMLTFSDDGKILDEAYVWAQNNSK